MRKLSLIAVCGISLLYAPAAHAVDRNIDMTSLEVSQKGDTEMTCGEIHHEIQTMDEVIQYSQVMRDDSKAASTGVTVAKTVGSYLVGSLGGAIGIMAAGYIVSEAAGSKEEDAMAVQDAATQRRRFMQGIHKAKGCTIPLPPEPEALASIEPAAGETFGPPDRRQRKPKYNN